MVSDGLTRPLDPAMNAPSTTYRRGWPRDVVMKCRIASCPSMRGLPRASRPRPCGFQDPQDCQDRVPIPCRRRQTEQPVKLAKIADSFHVPTVHSENESVVRCNDSEEPRTLWRKVDWNGSPQPTGSCQDAHEPDNVRAYRLGSKGIFRLETNEIAGVAEHDFSLEWQLPKQLSTELCSRSRFAHDERARSTHIDDVEAAQFACQDARAKRPVSADVDTSEENNER